eukprot:TRINITY_DN9792_c0_g1_i1.p1 TRINITY_DN9792_c0_g1~~TRINITY_DN9792_c0_g1_i1.p1  ORF type:complete len:277 (-),score=27.24 TRINITY_DN9792_c0_g1_i1:6-836(-)
MIRRPPRSTQGVSSAASDVYKRQVSTQSTWDYSMVSKVSITGNCSIPAKSLHYFSNGTGRDGYISSNSGGLIAPRKVSLPPISGSFPRSPYYRERSPRMEAKGVFYHSNGTGRDSYITVSSGGLHIPTRFGLSQQSFFKTLRSPTLSPINSILSSTRNSSMGSTGMKKISALDDSILRQSSGRNEARFSLSKKSRQTPVPASGIQDIKIIFLHCIFIPVSYTHLRAHETSLHLVCRLLLEKKKKNKKPPKYSSYNQDTHLTQDTQKQIILIPKTST